MTAERKSFEEKVLRTMEKYRMVRSGEKVLAGVSGGRDSIVLLEVLARLLPEIGGTLAVCCIHHGLRAAADEEVEFVRRRAEHYGLPFAAAAVDVPKNRLAGESIEEAARRLRYQALEEAARRFGAHRIAVGHHWDDHVETVLMRVILGTGVDGLGGIPPVRESIIRPLIDCTLEEITDYAHARRLEWRLDESNLDPQFFRNRVRLALLPHLAKEYNPRVKDALSRLSEIAGEESRWLNSLAAEAEESISDHPPLFAAAPSATFLRDRFTGLPVALQRRILHRAWSRVSRDRPGQFQKSGYGAAEEQKPLKSSFTASFPGVGPDFESIEGIRAMASDAGRDTRGLDLPGGIRARTTPAHVHIFRRRLEENPDYAYPLKVPGSIHVTQIGLTIEARWIEGEDGWSCCHSERPPSLSGASGHNMPYERGTHSGANGGKLATGRRWELRLKAEALPCGGSGLVVRNPRPGDRWPRPGGAPARRLRTVLADAGVPLPIRASVPVIMSSDRMVAAMPLGAVPDAGASADCFTDEPTNEPAKILALEIRSFTPEPTP